ncbi:hypothetical protein ACJZ2D_014673 [Fusarium nematophilum]
MIRSRGGCLNWRQRRRKCDQQRPSCTACNRRLVQFSGYSTEYRWMNHAAEPNRHPGQGAPHHPGSAVVYDSSHPPSVLQPSMTLPAPPPMYDSRTTQTLFTNYKEQATALERIPRWCY